MAPNALGGSGGAGTLAFFFRLSSGWPFGGQVVGQNPPQKGCGHFVPQTSGHTSQNQKFPSVVRKFLKKSVSFCGFEHIFKRGEFF